MSTGAITGNALATGTPNFTVQVTGLASPTHAIATAFSIAVTTRDDHDHHAAERRGNRAPTSAQTLAATGGTPGYTWTATVPSDEPDAQLGGRDLGLVRKQLEHQNLCRESN